MKKHAYSILKVMAVLFALFLFAIPVHATELKESMYLSKSDKFNVGKLWIEDAKLSDVIYARSSNTKIATVKVRASDPKKEGGLAKFFKVICDVKFKNTGKVTITCRYKDSSGTVHTDKKHYTVSKYKNPFSAVKIGGKEFKSKFNSTWECNIPEKTISGKQVSIKLRSGWKMISVYLKRGEKNYKLGKSFKRTFKKKDMIQITIQDKAGTYCASGINLT